MSDEWIEALVARWPREQHPTLSPEELRAALLWLKRWSRGLQLSEPPGVPNRPLQLVQYLQANAKELP